MFLSQNSFIIVSCNQQDFIVVGHQNDIAFSLGSNITQKRIPMLYALLYVMKNCIICA